MTGTMRGIGKRIVRRDSVSPIDCESPLLGRLFAARGLESAIELDHSLRGLLPPSGLRGIHEAAEIVATAIEAESTILIVGDFDADGATSCALLVSSLKAMGVVSVSYLVPDRFKFGYGLSPEIVQVAAEFGPDLLVTVDNGISSQAGVALANNTGMQVIITDHHLPGAELPAAAAIVNPNQPDCHFESKHLAGVGVAFYLLSAVRAELRARGWFDSRTEPNLAEWLDLVALGTIADVVQLDQNNRRLVSEGLRRIRAGRARPGLNALIEIAGLDRANLVTRDLAFSIAPRLNAAGRLQDMTLGIECLLATGSRAEELAYHLDELNKERRDIERNMRDEALQVIDALSLEGEKSAGLCLYRSNWHEGVVGIIASRIKERTYRPAIAFAPVSNGELKGSGRSVAGFHLRDALDALATENPGLLLRFGGHAMAAGLSIKEADFDRFCHAFNNQVTRVLGNAGLEQVVTTDGSLDEEITLEIARLLELAAPWGQGFSEPQFDDDFEVLEQRILGGSHLKLLLQPSRGQPVDAICFNHPGLLEARHIHCVYRIEVNRYRGREQPQLVVLLVA
jgi:single-stranded-DNA-specific exonuclease